MGPKVGVVFVFLGVAEAIGGARLFLITSFLLAVLDLSHSDRKTCCHDNGLRGQNEDFSQCQRHHRGGQADQSQVRSQGLEVQWGRGGPETEVTGRTRLF